MMFLHTYVKAFISHTKALGTFYYVLCTQRSFVPQKGNFCGCCFGDKTGFSIKSRISVFSIRILEFSCSLEELAQISKTKWAAVIVWVGMAVLSKKSLAFFFSLRHEAKQADQEMNISKRSFRWHCCFCTILCLKALILCAMLHLQIQSQPEKKNKDYHRVSAILRGLSRVYMCV